MTSMTSGTTLTLDPARCRTNLHEPLVGKLRPYARAAADRATLGSHRSALRPPPRVGRPRPGWQNGPPTGSQRDGVARPWERPPTWRTTDGDGPDAPQV